MKDTGKNMWLDNLPQHSPSGDLWEKIESGLEMETGHVQLQEQLAGLPVHQPPVSLWNRIEAQLKRRNGFRIGYIASAIAATLFLFFILRGIYNPEVKEKTTSSALPVIALKEKSTPGEKSIKENISFDVSKTNIVKRSNHPVLIVDSVIEETTLPASENSGENKLAFISPLKILPVLSQNRLAKTEIPFMRKTVAENYLIGLIKGSDTLLPSHLNQNTEYITPPPLPKIAYQTKGFSLGVDYLPEPIPNPVQGTSVYHSFGLTAQYRTPSIEFRSGFGISAYSIPADFSAQYLSYSSLSAGSDTIMYNGDTISTSGIMEGQGGINIYGSEQSRFFNYWVGAGKRIYNKDRLSASLQVGAGFSLLLSQNDNLQSNTYEALKNKANTYINDVESNIPEINRSRFNLLTGFDFNYRLLKKWSISVEPTLKYYFSPIYNGRNSRTFSTGVRTGILFKL